MTMSTAGSSISAFASLISTPGGSVTPRSRVMSTSATRTSSIGTPVRRLISALLPINILATPVPTVPNPIRPTPIRSFFTLASLRFSELQRLLDAPHGLPGPVLVFDQPEPHVLIPALAEADPRRHGDLCFFQQQLREFERAHPAKRWRNPRPDEHR